MRSRVEARLFALLLVAFELCSCGAFEGDWKLPVEDSFSDENQFSPRGHIALARVGGEGTVTGRFFSDVPLSKDFKRKLGAAAAAGRAYRIRTMADIAHPNNGQFVTSFTDSCRLLRSDMTEVLLLTIDSAKQRVLSLTVQPVLFGAHDTSPCTDADADFSTSTSFNTTVIVKDVEDGPSPDTQSYIQKMDKERTARQHGAQADNRSFIAKYWMYIIPVVLFVVMSGAMNNEAPAAAGN
uniref:ER membrane protein complex subunit 10 n=1 Tax=Plectus sambesii TaxID=2011161 RepID=A0A914VQN6_9BILA